MENISSIYETEPIGYTDQTEFLNMAIKISTDLSAFDLLEVLQDIEIVLDRKREIRWGPRTLDLDILLYNHDNIETETLSVPHPRMHETAFVIIPLLEIEPNISVSDDGNAHFRRSLNILQIKKEFDYGSRKNGEDVFVLLES